jgi:hypothetical protein
MAINQLIAAGIQQPRFESPLNMMAQFAQLQQAQQANALNQMRMQQMERQMAHEEALGGMDYATLSQNPEAALRYGAPGRALYGEMLKGQRERRQGEQAQRDAELKSLGTLRFALADVNDQPSYDRWRGLVGQLAPSLKDAVKPEYDPEVVKRYQVEADKRLEAFSPKPTQMRLGDRVVTIDTNPNSPTYNQEISTRAMGVEPKSPEELARIGAETQRALAATDVSRAELAGTLPARPGVQTELTRLLAERDRLAPNDPNRAAYDARIEALGRVGGTTVNVGAGEREEEKARGAGLAKEEETVSTLAQSARRQLTSIDSAQRVLDAGFRTGFGTDVKAKAANFLAAMGVKDAGKFATNAQTFLQAIKENVLAKQLEQKGVQTNQDAERIEQTFAQLGNTPEANQFMLDVARAQAKRSIEQDQFYRKWIAENKTMRGARDAWFETEGDKSLFERPELQRYAPQQRGAVGGEQPEVIDFRSLKR